MSKLKTINLKGKKYVQVNTRVEEFHNIYKNGKIETEVTILDRTVWFKATITPDVDKPERFFNGHSFGEVGREKAFEKLETVSVGRALAFLGVGIIESIASSDEMNNFNNQSKYPKSEQIITKEAQGRKPQKMGALWGHKLNQRLELLGIDPRQLDIAIKGKIPHSIVDFTLDDVKRALKSLEDTATVNKIKEIKFKTQVEEDLGEIEVPFK